jgi:hypothetical protein
MQKDKEVRSVRLCKKTKKSLLILLSSYSSSGQDDHLMVGQLSILKLKSRPRRLPAGAGYRAAEPAAWPGAA